MGCGEHFVGPGDACVEAAPAPATLVWKLLRRKAVADVAGLRPAGRERPVQENGEARARTSVGLAR